MRHIHKWLGTVALAVGLLLAPSAAVAERASVPRGAEETVEMLRAELARVNAEVAALKSEARSMRNDYRLRERMADAEALARRLTAAEASLRARPGAPTPVAAGAPLVAPPPASPQDGSVELQAKADLLVDQARKLDGQAEVLANAARELRSRTVMRRKAGSWDRDPFSGLETSRRNVAASLLAPKVTSGASTTESGARGPAAPTSTASAPAPVVSGTAGSTPPPPAALVPAATADSAEKSTTKSPASDGAVASKFSPVPQSSSADRQAVEQRLYLDPTTAAELRQALGGGGGALEPSALERGAAALRARARTLQDQAQALRARSRTP
jgi:hypothetical protein